MTEETTETETEETPEEKPSRPESVRETIERAVQETSQPEEPESQPESEEKPEPTEKPQPERTSPVNWPSNLRAEEKHRLAQLPPDAQHVTAEILARREADLVRHLTQRTQEAAKIKQAYQGIEKALEPVAQDWRLRGVDPANKIRGYVEFENLLERNPQQAIGWLANEYGVELSQLVNRASQQPQDPRVRQLEEQVQALSSQLEGFSNQTKEQEQQQIIGLVQSFVEATDENGTPLHPFARELIGEIADEADRLLEADPAIGMQGALSQAYHNRLWANPQTRSALMQSREEQLRKAQEEDQKKKVAEARKRGVSISGTGANGSKKPVPKTVRETIEAAMRGEI